MSQTPSEVHWSYTVVEQFMDIDGIIDYENAYNDLCKKYDLAMLENQALREKLRIAKEALEFYGNANTGVLFEKSIDEVMQENIIYGQASSRVDYDGNIAKHALEKIGELEEK